MRADREMKITAGGQMKFQDKDNETLESDQIGRNDDAKTKEFVTCIR